VSHFKKPAAIALNRSPLESDTLAYNYYQGHIKPPKAARGHATFVDGKMLSVTKYRIQILLV